MESGQGIISGAVMAAVDFEAAARALGAGMLPCSALLTELLGIAAAQEAERPRQRVTKLSGMS